MRLWLALVMIMLTGCAPDTASVLLPPSTPNEKAEVQTYINKYATVNSRMAGSNADLCQAGNSLCSMNLRVSVSDGIGAFSNPEGIDITVPLLRYLKNDDELALILGHEQAHRLLHHVRGEGFDSKMELTADCVGTLLAKRAGYDPVKGSAVMGRLAAAETTQQIVLAAVGIFGGGAKLDWGLRVQTIARAAGTGDTTAAGINRACGVRL